MNKIKLGLIPVLLMLLIGITSCEQEDRFVGSNVVGSDAANLFKTYVDVNAKTLTPDSIRADRSMLINATVGVYDENIFGKTKSYLYSQVRLKELNPTFGENPVVDSVILSIPVFGKTKSAGDTISTSHSLIKTTYTLKTDSNNNCTVEDTLKQYETKYLFKIDSLYGNRNSTMTLQVHGATESLGSINNVRYSNQEIEVGELFGSKEINSNAYKRSIAQFRNSDTDSTSIYSDTSPTINMHLEGMKNFIQTNIVAQEGSTNLGDQISFINNVLPGIRIGVSNENGFLFNINPSLLKLNAYISYDNPSFSDENGNGIHDNEEGCDVVSTTARKVKTFNFIIGSNLATSSGNQFYNVVESRIINENGTIPYNQDNLATNYVEGLGGAKTVISFDDEQISAIRDSIANKGWVVSEARLKVYPDMDVQGNLTIPKYLYLYNYTDGSVLDDYGSAEVFSNTNNIQAFPYLQISRPYGDDNNPYYLLRVTEFIKNIVEKNQEIDDLAIEMGTYLGYKSTNYFYAPQTAYYSNRIYNPYRLAIVGGNPNAVNSDKKLQLEIFYNKK